MDKQCWNKEDLLQPVVLYAKKSGDNAEKRHKSDVRTGEKCLSESFKELNLFNLSERK